MKRFCTALAALFCSAVAAFGSGPDVIVGDIPETSNYTSGGAVNSRRSYAIGTTSCNLGDQPLAWISSTNQHPVISQNLYRLMGGRFEQIGQAWLKHGFCALQGDVCADCPGTGNCSALEPNCSDPYSSGLNGQQSGLGPKSEVNASTGAFPYPWVNNGSGSGALFKRLQALDSELGNAGALYFSSSMYVQPQDAASGNDNNNESYRQITVAATSKDISVTGSTQRTKPGIQAWRDQDASVSLVSVDVASDGRFWIASKATDLGGGQWHYEYAIQNLTSHRSGQAFRVPFPAGAVITNIGFRDVEYHSGEPYSGTDWTSSTAGNGVTWATQTFAQNQNANALRWDTLYNFRFDCNIPPAGDAATLTLFRPGTPASVNVSVIAPSPDGTQHPLNDDCADATPIGNGAHAFNTAGATTDGPNEPTACNFAGDTQVGADIWYLYTAACTGTVDVRTCGSVFDTKIAIYNGTVCPTAASAIACNDDSNTCGTNSLQSQLTFSATIGQPYLIRLGGYNGATGSGTLTIADNCGPQAPANDLCANAFWLADNVAQNGSNTLATLDGTASCGLSSGTPDVWYKYRPVTSATVNFNTCGSALDTVLSVHSACGGSQLACNDDNGNGGNNACGGGLSSGLNLACTAGTTYWVRISGYNGLTGNFVVRAVGGGGVIPPSNDDCANRAGIALGATAFSTAGAATDGPTHTLCNQNGSNAITNDIWYNFPSPQSGVLEVSTCGSANFNTRIAVYDGAGCTSFDTRILACNDNGTGCGTTSEVTLSVVSGQNYTIRLGGTSGATGSGSIVLTFNADEPPTITQHPANTSACVGGSAGFTVVATGTAPLSYQWRRGTTNLVNSGNIAGATTASLTINPVGTGDAATNYNCVVTNAQGSATSNNATLTVNTAPAITGQPASLTRCTGTSASFAVIATGTGLTYQWRRGIIPIVNGGNISGATTATLTINPVGGGDAGSNYNCVVSGTCAPSATSNNATLTVNTAPAITGQPANQTVNVGGSASFSVTATGTGLTYQWRRGTTNLANGGNISGATSATLTINPVSLGDAATNYNCVVSGTCSPPATSNNATLTVNQPPCPGDVTGDNIVDIADLAVLLAHFGTASGATPADGDLDGDGDVELDDLAAILALFGTTC